MCQTCGGDWTEETSSLSDDQSWPSFFEIRGAQCSGDPQHYSYPHGDGLSLCCKPSSTSMMSSVPSIPKEDYSISLLTFSFVGGSIVAITLGLMATRWRSRRHATPVD